MKTQILTILFLLGMSFGTANAGGYCEEVHVVPIQNELQSCGGEKSETVEVVIHNPSYCGSTIESISLTDSENFELNTSYGVAPCESDVLCMRGYQFCTVGVTFKPVTTSGTFLTDITVNRLTTAVAAVATITGEIIDCCEETTSCSDNSSCNDNKCKKQNRHHNDAKSCDSDDKHKKQYRHRNGTKSCDVDCNDSKCEKQYRHRNGTKSCDVDCNDSKCEKQNRHHNDAKSCDSDDKHEKQYRHHNGKKCNDGGCDSSSTTSCITPTVEQLYDSSKTNYLASLNLLNSSSLASQISIVDNEVIFDNYNEEIAGLATFELDKTINFVSMLTFTANIDDGRFMPIMSGDYGEYMTNHVKRTNKYGFIFPNNLSLNELDFTTWGLSFTGSVVDLSVTEVTNTNILAKEQ